MTAQNINDVRFEVVNGEVFLNASDLILHIAASGIALTMIGPAQGIPRSDIEASLRTLTGIVDYLGTLDRA